MKQKKETNVALSVLGEGLGIKVKKETIDNIPKGFIQLSVETESKENLLSQSIYDKRVELREEAIECMETDEALINFLDSWTKFKEKIRKIDDGGCDEQEKL
jgi:hypothetical protein